jgi:hypothetical protein
LGFVLDGLGFMLNYRAKLAFRTPFETYQKAMERLLRDLRADEPAGKA